MLEKNNKISVLTKMIGIGDEKTPQLIVPQNSLTNFHARMGLTEKSVNMAGSGAQAPTISCPHCQNMAKNFLYLESLIRANGNPKNKCSLCSSTLRYVEYVNKSILDVFAKNASIIEAAQKYSTAKPRFRMPKLMSRVSRLAGGGKKSNASAQDSPYATLRKTTGHPTTSAGAMATTSKKGNLMKRKSKSNELQTGKSNIFKNLAKVTKTTKSTEKFKRETIKGKNNKSNKQQGSKSSLKNTKGTSKARSIDSFSERSSKSSKKSKTIKTKKSTTSATTLKKQNLKIQKPRIGMELNAPITA